MQLRTFSVRVGLLCLVISSLAQAGVSRLGSPAQAPSPAASASAHDEVGLHELQDAQGAHQGAIQQLNRLNPMSAEYSPGAVPPGGVASGTLTGPAAQLQKLLANPAVQGYLRFFNSPTFANGAEALASHPNRTTLIWVEVIWVLLMFVVRSWRLSRLATSNWGQVLWVNLSHFFLLWGGTLIVIPWVLFGEPYRQVLWGLWATLKG